MSDPISDAYIPNDQPGAPLDPELAISRLARAAKLRDEQSLANRKRKRREWALLAFILSLILIPSAILASFPQAMAKHIPGAARLYSGLGIPVNIYGLTISHIEPELKQTDAGPVLTLQGNITNIGQADRKIPPLRFSLLANEKEIFSWNLPASNRALKPGENTGFLTRIAAPPETAEKIEIRFAREGEIGSNAKP